MNWRDLGYIGMKPVWRLQYICRGCGVTLSYRWSTVLLFALLATFPVLVLYIFSSFWPASQTAMPVHVFSLLTAVFLLVNLVCLAIIFSHFAKPVLIVSDIESEPL